MSGGVDSSVTAAILKAAGAEVIGVFMKLAQPDLDEQLERVQTVAGFLDIPLEVMDFGAAFRQEVLQYFAASYFAGKTPNPCIVCNRTLKCGLLLDQVRRKLGAHYLATGHYARRVREASGRILLLKGKDDRKDQSYFLSRLTQEQLRHLLFPLGEMRKKDVVQQAAKLGLGGRHGKESQDICFLKQQSVADFLRAYESAVDLSGPIMTVDGREVGRHRGIHCFTVGQRRGLGIPDQTPYYVVRLEPRNKAVIIGKEEDLLHSVLEVRDLNWVAGEAPALPAWYDVKIRYRHKGARARVESGSLGGLRVIFETPQRAITPGQFAVLYDGEEVVAGGEISRTDD